jgi:hypothetical protein
MVAWSPKAGTYLNRALRVVLGKLLPNECLWYSGGEWSEDWTEHSKAKGPVVPGVADYRMIVTIRDPFQLAVSAYVYFGLYGAEGGMCEKGYLGDVKYCRKQGTRKEVYLTFRRLLKGADRRTMPEEITPLLKAVRSLPSPGKILSR